MGGAFHIKLVLSQDFPNSPPRGFFLTKIYHPNVSNTGDICVNTLKKDWTPATTLIHVLQVIRCLLIVPFPESSLNDEAGKQFMESYDDYAKRARLLTSVHAMRTKGNTSSSPTSGGGGGGASGGDAAAPDKDSKLPANGGEEEEDAKAPAGGGGGGGGGEGTGAAGVLGSPNVAGLAKRKVNPNQKDTTSRLMKKKSLKRL